MSIQYQPCVISPARHPHAQYAQHCDERRLVQAKMACSMSNSFSSTFTSNTTQHNQCSERDHRAENEYFSVNRIDERNQVEKKVKPEPPFSHLSPSTRFLSWPANLGLMTTSSLFFFREATLNEPEPKIATCMQVEYTGTSTCKYLPTANIEKVKLCEQSFLHACLAEKSNIQSGW